MSIVLLRTMTLKSKIGFGNYRDLCVQELINLNKHSELIQMYYHLDRIDFTDEVKYELHIKKERIIPKPGKNHDIYAKYIYQMIGEILEVNKTFDEDNPNRWNMLHEKKAERKRNIVSNCIRQNKEKSKIGNRNRNQRHL